MRAHEKFNICHQMLEKRKQGWITDACLLERLTSRTHNKIANDDMEQQELSSTDNGNAELYSYKTKHALP